MVQVVCVLDAQVDWRDWAIKTLFRNGFAVTVDTGKADMVIAGEPWPRTYGQISGKLRATAIVFDEPWVTVNRHERRRELKRQGFRNVFNKPPMYSDQLLLELVGKVLSPRRTKRR